MSIVFCQSDYNQSIELYRSNHSRSQQKQQGQAFDDLHDQVAESNFGKKEQLIAMAQDIKMAYREHFTHGDRDLAEKELEPFNPTLRRPFILWRAGLASGLAVGFMIHGLKHALKPSTQHRLPFWAALLQIYSALFLPVVLAALLAVDLAAWRSVRVNYILIFNIDRRSVPFLYLDEAD